MSEVRTVVFDEDDPLVQAINHFASQFGIAYSTSASGVGGTGGVVEFNGMKQTETLERIAESLDSVAEALEGIANAIMRVGDK